jgi:hypothetical protein
MAIATEMYTKRHLNDFTAHGERGTYDAFGLIWLWQF